LLIMLLAGCQSANPVGLISTDISSAEVKESQTAVQPDKNEEDLTMIPTAALARTIPTSTPTPEQLDPTSLWEGSPHAKTHGLSKGPNSYCAKCHSPFNWDPKAQIGTAPNCVSCKLPAEDEPRFASQNPMISIEDWKDISCNVCHEITGDVVSPSIAWWNQETGNYEVLTHSTELCNKCHIDTQLMKHLVDLDDSAHSRFECLDCHNPHSTVATCSNSGCHVDVFKPGLEAISTPVGNHTQVGDADCGGPGCHISATEVAVANVTVHGAAHSLVVCIACHAAGTVQVGRYDENGAWGIFQSVQVDGNLLTFPSSSHTITKQVDCTRCHFDGNSWSLRLVSGHEFGQ
jgi:hypothetical protein